MTIMMWTRDVPKTAANYAIWLEQVNALAKRRGRVQIRNKNTWAAFRGNVTPTEWANLHWPPPGAIEAKIYHWFLGSQEYEDHIMIPDLADWIAAHSGAVQVRPPSVTGHSWWLIIVTDDSNRFNQR